jgi:hypothetical protein
MAQYHALTSDWWSGRWLRFRFVVDRLPRRSGVVDVKSVLAMERTKDATASPPNVVPTP